MWETSSKLKMEHGSFSRKKPSLTKFKQGSHDLCSCSNSGNQPFCDKEHCQTSYKALRINLIQDRMLAMCNCRQSEAYPLCDGAHCRL